MRHKDRGHAVILLPITFGALLDSFAGDAPSGIDDFCTYIYLWLEGPQAESDVRDQIFRLFTVPINRTTKELEHWGPSCNGMG